MNFRLHPDPQRDVLRGLLGSIGIDGAVYVWVPDDKARAALTKLKPGNPAAFAKWLAGYTGDFQLYDGHLRVEEIQDQLIPVLVTDLTLEEAQAALMTFDAVGDLVQLDRERLLAGIGDFSSASEAVMAMVADLAKVEERMREAMADDAEGRDLGGGGSPPPEDFPEFDESIETEHKCPKCAYVWSGKAS